MSVDLGLGFAIPAGQAEHDVVNSLRAHNPTRAHLAANELLRSVAREEIVAAIAEVHHIPFIPGITKKTDLDLLAQCDALAVRRAQMVPIHLSDQRITVAIANPYNPAARDYLAQHYSEHEHVFLLVTLQEVDAALETLAQDSRVTNDAINSLDILEERNDVREFVLADRYDDPIPEQMRGIFLDAVKRQASDIHIITALEGFYYKLRVNGDLTNPITIDSRLIPRIDAYMLSLVNIEREKAISTIGLSGRFSLVPPSGSGRIIDCRFERHRTFRGYHMTIRLLDKMRVDPRLGTGGLAFEDRTEEIHRIHEASGAAELAEGHSETAIKTTALRMSPMMHLRRAMEMSDGIIILSGPTGSGKSTTLNAMLREVAKPKYCVLTLENPVEYEIPGVIHCNMRDNAEFGSYIRSFMRSDPDVILMGEVRDQASASLAVEASMTGHQVFTTVHTNSAAEIIDRFIQLGVNRVDIARTVRLLCGQRLVKTLCRRCCVATTIDAEVAQLYSLPRAFVGRSVFAASQSGCSECGWTGISGRKAVVEVLPVDVEASELITSGATAHQVEESVRKRHGLTSLREQGLEMLWSGESDLASIKDVINLGY